MINRFVYALIICGVSLTVLSCQNEARWYPDAEAQVSARTEYSDPLSGAKALAVTLIVKNTGDTTILSSTVTVKATTNRREYLQTVSSAARIIPGGSIAVNLSFAYLDSAETLVENGVSVYDAFFE